MTRIHGITASFFLLWAVGILQTISTAEIEQKEFTEISDNFFEVSDIQFQGFIETHNITLVAFYAPWCFWSQTIMESFASAAAMMSHYETPVAFCRVDATKSNALRQKYGIYGYPELMLFVDKIPVPYNGGRGNTQIVQWLQNYLNSEVIITSVEHLKTVLGAHLNDVVVIGTFTSTEKTGLNDVLSKNLLHLSQHFKDMFFCNVFDLSAIGALGDMYTEKEKLEAPYIIIVNPYNRTSVIPKSNNIFTGVFNDEIAIIPYKGDLGDYKALEEFVYTHRLPAVIPFTDNHLKNIATDERLVFGLFVDPTLENSRKHVSALSRAASLYRKNLLFVVSFLGTMSDQRLAHVAGVEGVSKPTYRIFNIRQDSKTKYIPSEAALKSTLEDGMIEFAKQYVEGKLEPYYKSEPVPTYSEGALKIVVGQTFKEEIINNTNDCFVIFFAPWCGHCVKLEPSLIQLASMLEGIPTVVVAKIDATRNEVPGIQIYGYPTIVFYRGSSKSTAPMTYSGERSPAAMMEFIFKHAHHRFSKEEVLRRAVDGQVGNTVVEREKSWLTVGQGLFQAGEEL